ncbi:hypothetical protein AJ80_10103 [Polytolypa hystricis UAMH7299]|uniref:Uncharacterized protein n=1 Tax=Polytolypa hystricis (strain UAMH7299) TaxID=1447883 RepID=A0A2B7WE73_POLH7|nr:hypothetical protein AJ80_10103 [Polytolypa hystricis UAMH7299]
MQAAGSPPDELVSNQLLDEAGMQEMLLGGGGSGGGGEAPQCPQQ